MPGISQIPSGQGGNDVLGATIVQRLGVRSHGGANSLGNLCVGHLGGHVASLPEQYRGSSTIKVRLSEVDVDDGALERIQVDRLQRREQFL